MNIIPISKDQRNPKKQATRFYLRRRLQRHVVAIFQDRPRDRPGVLAALDQYFAVDDGRRDAGGFLN